MSEVVCPDCGNVYNSEEHSVCPDCQECWEELAEC
jgi:NMD protein affecting ribosome stability and mRNA decay